MERSPHDVLFRHAFAQPEHARGLLQALLPAGLAAAVDWASLRLQPGSFVDPKLRQQQTDLVWSASVRGVEATIYLLVEHKARDERFAETAATLRSWRELLGALARAPSAAEALEALFRYVLMTTEGRPERLLEVVAEVLEDEPMGKRMTAGQILIERGRQEGQQEGRLAGVRALFLAQLRARFRRLAAKVVARVERADADELERWAVRLLDAERLDDVFARS